eukprot:6205095-Pleurochrysis_carterae.AAC.8
MMSESSSSLHFIPLSSSLASALVPASAQPQTEPLYCQRLAVADQGLEAAQRAVCLLPAACSSGCAPQRACALAAGWQSEPICGPALQRLHGSLRPRCRSKLPVPCTSACARLGQKKLPLLPLSSGLGMALAAHSSRGRPAHAYASEESRPQTDLKEHCAQ